LPFLGELAQSEVELHGPEGHAVRRFGRRYRPAAAQHALDAQQQLARLERLAEIVVDALLEPGDSVFRIAHGGQHQDRHGVGLAQLAGEVEAGLAGHHHVEHDQVEVERLELLVRRGGVCRRC